MSTASGTTPSARAAGFVALCADPDAFARWYERALPRVYGYVRAQTGGDIALAEDITQHAFVQAIRALKSFDGRADPITWICSIARNALLNHYRREQREWRRRVTLVGEIEMPEPLTSPGQREREDLIAALGLLSSQERSAVVMKYVDEMSVHDIARALGRTEAATESLLARARARLRTHLGERS